MWIWLHILVHFVKRSKYFKEYTPWIGVSAGDVWLNWSPLLVSHKLVSWLAKSPAQFNRSVDPTLLISINSPMARGLIGKIEGDICNIETPSGKKEFEIINVIYE